MHLVEALHFDLEFESLKLSQVPHSLGEVVDELASTLRPYEVGTSIDLPSFMLRSASPIGTCKSNAFTPLFVRLLASPM